MFIVLEFQQYYNENCLICKRHYYYCTLRKAAVLNNIAGTLIGSWEVQFQWSEWRPALLLHYYSTDYRLLLVYTNRGEEAPGRVYTNLPIRSSGHTLNRVHCSEFIVVATNITCVLTIHRIGHKQSTLQWPQTVHVYLQFVGVAKTECTVVATNSTRVTHEVLVGVVSNQLVLKELGKIKKFVPPIKMVHWGSPPIRMVPPAVVFLLCCTSGRTVSVYSTRIPRVL